MVSIHNYGIRHRYGSRDRDAEAGSGRAGERPAGPDHWSSDDPTDDDRPVRGPAGPDEADGRRKKFFRRLPDRRKSE